LIDQALFIMNHRRIYFIDGPFNAFLLSNMQHVHE